MTSGNALETKEASAVTKVKSDLDWTLVGWEDAGLQCEARRVLF